MAVVKVCLTLDLEHSETLVCYACDIIIMSVQRILFADIHKQYSLSLPYISLDENI